MLTAGYFADIYTNENEAFQFKYRPKCAHLKISNQMGRIMLDMNDSLESREEILKFL